METAEQGRYRFLYTLRGIFKKWISYPAGVKPFGVKKYSI